MKPQDRKHGQESDNASDRRVKPWQGAAGLRSWADRAVGQSKEETLTGRDASSVVHNSQKRHGGG